YCGKRFQVFKRAHKTCDTVNPVAGRRVADAVHLELRCDGRAYGNCQAACLIFWKAAWLRPVNERSEELVRAAEPVAQGSCTEQDVGRATRAQDDGANGEPRYACQATQLPLFTTPLAWWDPRQYIEDLVSGNVTLGRVLSGLLYSSYYNLTFARRNRLGKPARWLYDRFQELRGGTPFPRRIGTVPAGETTPSCTLNLQPGELVRIKSYKEILATLDSWQKNRGMYFDAELVPYCGGVYRVKARVESFVNERTGCAAKLKTPAVMLEGVWCQSRYSHCRMFCPRGIYAWWRE